MQKSFDLTLSALGATLAFAALLFLVPASPAGAEPNQLTARPERPQPFTCLSGSGKCYCNGESDCNKMKAKVCEHGVEPSSIGGGKKSCNWRHHATQSRGLVIQQPFFRTRRQFQKLAAASGGPQPYACTSDGWKCYCFGQADCDKLADSGECLDDVNDGVCHWQEGD